MAEDGSWTEIVHNTSSDVRKIMFVFHGYGADNKNIAPVGPAIAENCPGIEIHVPNGIEICEENETGYQWFSFGETYPDSYFDNEEAIRAHIDRTLKNKKISSYADLIFCGFSQGATVSLTLGLKLGVGMIISFAGALLDGSYPASGSKNTKIIMLHGELDTVVPAELAENAANFLRQGGLDASFVLDNDVGHAISENMLKEARKFLEKYIT
jgi:phospholipase/carboxylesterase